MLKSYILHPNLQKSVKRVFKLSILDLPESRERGVRARASGIQARERGVRAHVSGVWARIAESAKT